MGNFSNRHAFLIAVEKYQNDIPSLSTPIADTKSVAEVLNQKFEFEIHPCLSNPTQGELITFLESIPDEVSATDETNTQVIIYFAGHGVALDSPDGVKGYLLPSNVRHITNGKNTLADTSISMDFLVAIINKIGAQQVLLVLDCCFAGLIRWVGLSTHRGLDTEGGEGLFRQQFDYNIRHKVRQVFTSSSHDQRAVDLLGVRDDRNQNSPFVRFLLQALQGEADLNHDGVLMLEELQAYINGRLAVVTQQQNHDQITGFYPLAGHDCGSFLLFPKDFYPDSLTLKEVANPFKGLQTYDVKDQAIYPGRKTVINGIIELINQRKQEGSGIIVVSGVSGSGKSSVVRAGVVPRLPNFSAIPIVVPGRIPLAIIHELEQSRSNVVVLDQLEQIITQATDSSEGAVNVFLKKLIGLNKVVICTVRTDFEVQIFKNITLSEDPFSLYRMPRFEREDIRDIILKPAMRVGRFFYPESLIEAIVDDFLNYPNALSLLSLVLYELFEQCKQDIYHEITNDDYEAIGGLTGVLNRKIEALKMEFASKEEQTMLQNILLRMTSIRGGKLTARRAYKGELTFEEPTKQKQCDRIIQILADEKYRLIVEGRSELGKYVEPAHDVVVQSWCTQRELLDQITNGTLNLREALAADINKYDQKEKDTNYLWNNDPNLLLLGDRPKTLWLQLKWDWQPFKLTFRQQRKWFTKPEKEFVRRSFNRRKIVRGGYRMLILTVFLALIGIGWLYKITQNNLETSQLINLSTNTSDETLALQAAYKAWLLAPNNNTAGQLVKANMKKITYKKEIFIDPAISSLDIDRQGQYTAVAVDNLIRVYDWKRQLLLRTFKGHHGIVASIAFSPNGQIIASASWDNTIKLWDWKHNRLLQTLRGHTGFVEDVTFSPDGKTIASASYDNTIKLWDWQNHRLLRTLQGHTHTVYSVAFSSDGKFVASASADHTVKVWSQANNQLIVTLLGHTDTVKGVTFSPDGNSIASASWDKTIKVWDWKHNQVQTTLSGHKDHIESVAFSPDGQIITSASIDSTIKLWDWKQNRLQSTLQGHKGHVYKALFFSDGHSIASASADQTIKIWNRENKQLLSTIQTENGHVFGTGFSPDGRTISVAGWDNTIKVWNWKNHQLLYTTPIPKGTAKSVAFSPNAQFTALASTDNTVRIWDSHCKHLLNTLQGHKGAITSVSFSPDGQLIASASDDKTIRIWKWKDNQLIHTLEGFNELIDCVAFSADGQSIAVSNTDNTITIWNWQNDRLLYTLSGYKDMVYSLAFSTDGQFLASADMDNTIRVWDWKNQQLLDTYQELEDEAISVAFSPDGQILASSGIESIKVWTRFDNYLTNPDNVSSITLTKYFINNIDAYPLQKVLATAKNNYSDLSMLISYLNSDERRSQNYNLYHISWCYREALLLPLNKEEKGLLLEKKKLLEDQLSQIDLPFYLPFWWWIQRSFYQLTSSII